METPRLDRALGPLEAALDSAIKRDDADEVADLRFDFAQALYESGKDKARAKAIMKQAAEDFDALDRAQDAEDARAFIRAR